MILTLEGGPDKEERRRGRERKSRGERGRGGGRKMSDRIEE